MKWIRSVEDSRIIERELDDIKSSRDGAPASCGNYGGTSDRYGGYAGGGNSGNFAGGANSANNACGAGGRYGASNQQTFGASGQDSKKSSYVSCCTGVVFFASLAIIAAAVFYYLKIYMPEDDYRKANEALRAGEYVTAIRNFEALKDYKKSPQKLSEAKFYALNDSLKNKRYLEAKDYLKQLNSRDYENMRGKEDFLQAIKFSTANMYYRENEFENALSIYRQMGDYHNSRQMVNVCINKLGGTAYLANEEFASGNITKLGRFEQDNNLQNGPEPIEWIAAAAFLEKGEQHILLISKYCLDCRPYQDKKPFTAWKDSSLRRWLNDEFYNKAFSKPEREKMLAVPVGPDWCDDFYYFGNWRSSDVHSYYGPESKDKVFILSRWEYNAIKNKISENTSATPYAVSRSASRDAGSCMYWLRNYRLVSWPYDDNGNIKYIVDTPAIACIDSEARVVEADDKAIYVRPAIRIAVKGKPIPVEPDEKPGSADKGASKEQAAAAGKAKP